MALAGALCLTLNAVLGFTNRSLRSQVSRLLGQDYGINQMSYDLGRLRLNGSSNASTAPTATGSPPTGSASQSSTPSCTSACCARCSPARHHPPRQNYAQRWQPSTTTSPATSPPPGSETPPELKINVKDRSTKLR
jgi:hypothetical protein